MLHFVTIPIYDVRMLEGKHTTTFSEFEWHPSNGYLNAEYMLQQKQYDSETFVLEHLQTNFMANTQSKEFIFTYTYTIASALYLHVAHILHHKRFLLLSRKHIFIFML